MRLLNAIWCGSLLTVLTRRSTGQMALSKEKWHQKIASIPRTDAQYDSLFYLQGRLYKNANSTLCSCQYSILRCNSRMFAFKGLLIPLNTSVQLGEVVALAKPTTVNLLVLLALAWSHPSPCTRSFGSSPTTS